MKLKKISLAFLLATGLNTPVLLAQDNTTAPADAGFTAAQKDAIGNIAAQYIIAHPEILVEASKVLQQKEMAEQEQKATDAIGKNVNAIFLSKESPIAGNPNGSVSLVEFYDYQCGHCKQMAEVVDNLLKANPNLKVIFKEFPIFGGASEFAAKAALAAYAIDPAHYLAFHQALMAAPTPLSEDKILDLAKASGLDVGKLKTAMDSATVKQELENNAKLAESLGILGTPYFVIAKSTGVNPTAMPGAAPQDMLQQKVDSLK